MTTAVPTFPRFDWRSLVGSRDAVLVVLLILILGLMIVPLPPLLLDLMIAAGGLTDYAAGNDSVLIRMVDGQQVTYSVRLDDLVRDGDITANLAVMPGDILIIAESWF